MKIVKNLRKVVVAAILACTAAIIVVAVLHFFSQSIVSRRALPDDFVELRLPFGKTRELFDIGVADINADGHLDVFSANHNTRQLLWVSDGKGNFRDMLSAWGLDQAPQFPGVEISDIVPALNEPGVYIYWQGRNPLSRFPLVIRSHRLREIGRLEGTLQTHSAISDYEAGGFAVQIPPSTTAGNGEMLLNSLHFSTAVDATMKVAAASPGAPIKLAIAANIPLANIFVGPQRVSPKSHDFELALQDRHGMAWSDLNADGQLDVFVSRGAIGGTLMKFPLTVQEKVQDELLVSGPNGRYANVASSRGITKRGCSARKVSWVDFDRDGLLDLFVNCQERGFVDGLYPKQLYRQSEDGAFVDVAENVGLGLPLKEIIDFLWLDVDNDGELELVTHEAKGFFLYKKGKNGIFSERFLGRGEFVRADRPQLRGTSDEYWFVDGKLSAADFNGDGFIDILCSSKIKNTLLLNDGKGDLSVSDPTTFGLPGASAAAVWVDFDNDGLLDLFAVPQGIFRQGADHRFSSTGLFSVSPGTYMAAIANWADLNNDGRRDLVLAVLENFSSWRWWQKPFKSSADRFTWHLSAFQSAASRNNWLAVQLAGQPGNPQAIGARVSVKTASGDQTQVVGLNEGSFFSQGNYRLHFGLGSGTRVDSVEIRWPDGQVQELHDLAVNRLESIRQQTAGQRETKK